MIEQRDIERRRRDMVKGLLVHRGADMDEIKFQFPEYFDIDPFEHAKSEGGDYDIDLVDDSKIAWGSAASAEEDEALSRLIAEMEQGSLGADEL